MNKLTLCPALLDGEVDCSHGCGCGVQKDGQGLIGEKGMEKKQDETRTMLNKKEATEKETSQAKLISKSSIRFEC